MFVIGWKRGNEKERGNRGRDGWWKGNVKV